MMPSFMRAEEIIQGLGAFPGRGAGTDAERRAAAWLASQAGSGRRASLEPFWCRPNWPLAAGWHAALGIAGSLLSVGHPRVGAVLILLALLSVLCDAHFGVSPGRRLTPERASQNVISELISDPPHPRVRLIITANLDAGRLGLAYRPALRRRVARLHNMTGRRAPGWCAWLCIGLLWELATALARIEGSRGAAIAVLQLIPTVGLVLGLALLLELGSAAWAPAAGDNGSGVAVAVALARALDAAPPAQAAVALVLTGAGDGQGVGLRRYLRARRSELGPSTTVVLGIGPCADGRLRWLRSDGSLFPLQFFARLRALCREVAVMAPDLGLDELRARGSSPALPARVARLPAIGLGCYDEEGLVPRSHQPSDTPDLISPDALDRTLQAGLLLVDAIDAYLAGLARPG